MSGLVPLLSGLDGRIGRKALTQAGFRRTGRIEARIGKRPRPSFSTAGPFSHAVTPDLFRGPVQPFRCLNTWPPERGSAAGLDPGTSPG